MRLSRPGHMVSILFLWVLVGCGETRDQVAAFRVDTLPSGRVLIRNAPHATAPSHLRLERRIRIGAVDGDSARVFGRVHDVAIGPDEFLYVLDGQAAEVRVFDFEGNHVRSIGGLGDGPGELRGPYAIAFDSTGKLWIADERQRNYTVYDAAGAHVASFRRPIRWPITTGELAFSPTGLIQEYGWWGSGPGGSIRMQIATEVTVQDTIPLPPFGRALFARPDREGVGMAVPFAPHQAAAIGRSGEVWAGYGNAYRLAEITSRGDTAKLIELAVDAAGLSEAEQIALEDSVEMALRRGLSVEENRIPKVHPYFTSIVISDEGELWVRRASDQVELTASGGRGSVFDVFASTGEYVGSVPAPIAEWPGPQVRAGFLVGISRDVLGVDYVEVYRIVRS